MNSFSSYDTVIKDQYSAYNLVINGLKSTLANFKSNVVDKINKHIALSLKEYYEELDKTIKKMVSKTEQLQSTHIDIRAKGDDILERLSSIFNDRFGARPNEQQAKKFLDEAKDRYEKKIPPGFKDDKPGDNKYGDGIVRLQILERGKNKPGHLIFVTGDSKEDWWHIEDSKRKGPLRELTQEYFNSSEHLYSQFFFQEIFLRK